MPPPTNRLGAALRNRRKSLGLTQQELARLAGCGLAFLYELESGKATVRLDKLLGVLGVLGLELSLVEGKNALGVDTRWLREPS
jgi:y4mF family transcriptional regulator